MFFSAPCQQCAALPAKRNRGELGGALFDSFLMLVVLWGFLWQTLPACDVLNGSDPQLDLPLTPSVSTARQLPQSPPMEASTNCPRFWVNLGALLSIVFVVAWAWLATHGRFVSDHLDPRSRCEWFLVVVQY